MTAVVLHTGTAFVGLAQNNTILVYDPFTEMVDTIPAEWPTENSAAFLPHHTGAQPGYTPLAQIVHPEDFQGPGLERAPHAALTYPLTDFPLRTAGALRRIYPDSTRHRCSGQLVGPRHVLTARHCVYENATWREGLLDYFPMFDEGIPSIFGSVPAIRYFVPEQSIKDHALIELAEPIGEDLGWMGLSFTTDASYYNGRIVHKFSYPSTVSTADTNLVYSGDSLLHLATPMTYFPGTYPTLGVTGWTGVRGESGSGVWITSDTSYHVLGVCSWSTNYRHTLMDAGTFHQFRRVMEGMPISVASLPSENGLRIVPNPMANIARLELDGAANGSHQLTLLDALGRVVQHHHFQGTSYLFERGALPAGAYLMRIDPADPGSQAIRILIER